MTIIKSLKRDLIVAYFITCSGLFCLGFSSYFWYTLGYDATIFCRIIAGVVVTGFGLFFIYNRTKEINEYKEKIIKAEEDIKMTNKESA